MSTSCRCSTCIYETVHKLCVGCLTCLWSTTLSITEVMMQLMVLANMKIIILCQRHNGILVSLNREWRKHQRSVEIYYISCSICTESLIWSTSYLDLVPRICPTTRLDTPIPTICMEVARPMAVPRVAWGTTRGIDGHMLDWKTGFKLKCTLFLYIKRDKRIYLHLLKFRKSIWTHSSERVGDPQPYGGDERGDESEGQESKHRQREDGTGYCKNAPQAHVILKRQQESSCVTQAYLLVLFWVKQQVKKEI